jgi:hypothetical protein
VRRVNVQQRVPKSDASSVNLAGVQHAVRHLEVERGVHPLTQQAEQGLHGAPCWPASATPRRLPNGFKLLQLALNAYADLTWEEFSAPRLGYKQEISSNRYVCACACSAASNSALLQCFISISNAMQEAVHQVLPPGRGAPGIRGLAREGGGD